MAKSQSGYLRFLNTSMDDKATKLVYDAFKSPIELVFLSLATRIVSSHATLGDTSPKSSEI